MRGGSLILLNLVDDKEYRTYSNMGPAAFRPLLRHGFMYARLVPVRPVPDAWLVSGRCGPTATSWCFRPPRLRSGSALLEEGSSLARLDEAARLMLADQDVPSLTALTFAAAVAGAAGDAEEERRFIDQALAADEADDPDVRLEVIDFISASGHAAEAVELLEQRLKEAPDDDFAGDLYGAAIERAYAAASADETAARERAAVHRFADRTG